MAPVRKASIISNHTPLRHVSSSADLNAAIARITPDALALLGDGVPRSDAAIVAALAGRHPKDDVRRTVMRLAVLGRLAMRGGRYTLPAAEAGQG
jgi:hypothetical protein